MIFFEDYLKTEVYFKKTLKLTIRKQGNFALFSQLLLSECI